MAFNWYKRNPYGILPEGNKYTSSSSISANESICHERQRITFAKPDAPLDRLTPALIGEVISFLSPKDLCIASRSNWHWYAACHFPEVWKTLFILAANDSSSPRNEPEWNNLVHNLSLLNNNNRHIKTPLLHFEHNWKTFIVRLCMFADVSGSGSSNMQQSSDKTLGRLFVHKPLAPSQPKLSSLCSDSHFQSWLCSILPPEFKGKFQETSHLSFGKIMERKCEATKLDPNTNVALEYSYSPDEFRKEFEAPNLPVVLKGACKHWELYKILNNDFINLGVKASEILRPEKQNERFRCESVLLSLTEYCSYAISQQDERPIYMFDAHFQKEGFRENLWEVPEHFGRDDLFAALGEKNRPLYRWLIAGPKRSGSSFHIDPNYTSAWNACVTGKKRWLMFPPGCVPPGIRPSEDMSEVVAPASITEYLFSFYDAALDKFSGHGIECTVDAGDIIFVPAGWWHCVINLEDSVAITQNFVSQCNLKSVLRFLRCLKNSISGIGEETDDSETKKNENEDDADANTAIDQGGQEQKLDKNRAGPSRPGQQQSGGGNGMMMTTTTNTNNDDPEELERKRQSFMRVFAEAVMKYRSDLIPLVKEEDDEAQRKKEEANRRRRQREEMSASLNLNKKNGDGSEGNNGGGFSFNFM